MLWWAVAGALAAPALARLISPQAWPLAALAGCALLTCRPARRPALACLALAWGLAGLDRALEDRLRVSPGTVLRLDGVVTGLPTRRDDLLEFRFRAEALGGAMLLVRWYRDPPELRAGERWRLHLRLRPSRGRVNFSGPDAERWYLAQGIDALASVTSQGGSLLAPPSGLDAGRLRSHLRERLATHLAGHPRSDLVLALAIADRGGMDADVRRALAVTGTGHLLAISGLHVGLVAWFGYWLGRLASAIIPWRLLHGSPHEAALILGLMAAGAYAALAGFETSTRRALVMLAVVAVSVLARRTPRPLAAWGAALAAVLSMDPLAPLQAGFWLSFGAVGALIATFSPRVPPRGPIRILLTAQAAIVVVMLPLGMYWFQQATLAGMIVNLAAIPLVSLVTLPLTLAGLLALPVAEEAAEVLLWMAADSGDWVARAIRFGANHLGFLARPAAAPAPLALALALAGGALLLLPRGLRLRPLGLLLYLPVLLPPYVELEAGAVRLEVLDVGQGLATLVRTRHHALLYDTGPGYPGRWDLVDGVLRPALAGAGKYRVEAVVASHGDLDHAGGLDRLRADPGTTAFFANLPRRRTGIEPCVTGTRWDWDGVAFRVLHPTPFLPYLGNDSSCVIAVRGAGGSLLLPGDIGALVERRLALSGEAGEYDVLVAAHHGSRSSSSAPLLDWARPRHALIAAGYANRFGFPHPEVLERLRDRGVSAWSTAGCGAIRVDLGSDGSIRVASARRVRGPPWRWPAAPGCP